MPLKTIRIFLASPGDVQEERDWVRRIAADISATLFKRGIERTIQVFGWERDVAPGGTSSTSSTQSKIDELLIAADLVVGIFWKRFGTPAEGSDSATEHEIRIAVKKLQRDGRPDVWLYFRTSPIRPGTAAEAEQNFKVQRFREEFEKDNLGLYIPYDSVEEFVNRLNHNLYERLLPEAPSPTPNSDGAELSYHTYGHAVPVASEGYTERVGDIGIVLVRKGQVGSLSVELDIKVYFPTAITNRLLADRTSDIKLFIDSGAFIGYGRVSGSEVSFAKVSASFLEGDRETTFVMKDALVNAAGLMSPAAITAAPIVCEHDGRQIPSRQEHPPIVAVSRPTLQFWATTGPAADRNAPIRLDRSQFRGSPSASLHFGPQPTGMFRPGVQLKALFVGIPKGVKVSVASQPFRASETAYLVEAEGLNAPTKQSFQEDGALKFIPLDVDQAGDWCSAVWQIAADLPAGIRSYEFPVVLSAQDGTVIEPGRITVVGNLAPSPTSGIFTASTGSAASAKLPIPRYSDFNARPVELFEILP